VAALGVGERRLAASPKAAGRTASAAAAKPYRKLKRNAGSYGGAGGGRRYGGCGEANKPKKINGE